MSDDRIDSFNYDMYDNMNGNELNDEVEKLLNENWDDEIIASEEEEEEEETSTEEDNEEVSFEIKKLLKEIYGENEDMISVTGSAESDKDPENNINYTGTIEKILNEITDYNQKIQPEQSKKIDSRTPKYRSTTPATIRTIPKNNRPPPMIKIIPNTLQSQSHPISKFQKQNPEYPSRFRNQDEANEMKEMNLKTYELRNRDPVPQRNRLSLEEKSKLDHLKERYRKSVPAAFRNKVQCNDKSHQSRVSSPRKSNLTSNLTETDYNNRRDINYQTFDLRHGEPAEKNYDRLSVPKQRLYIKTSNPKIPRSAPAQLHEKRLSTKNSINQKKLTYDNDDDFIFADDNLEYDNEWNQTYKNKESFSSGDESLPNQYHRFGELNLTNILQEGPINFDSSYPISPELPYKRILIEDQYYPGLIEDSVNRKKSFNTEAKKALDFSNISNNSEKTMSLISAFDLRVKHEQNHMKNIFTQYSTSEKEHTKYTPQKLKPIDGDESRILPIVEENIRYTTAAIDCSEYIRSQPETELMKAITCLSRAQEMNDFRRAVESAEIAAKQNPEDAERAAVYGAKSFRADNITAKVVTVPGTKVYKPLEIVSYMGITNPLNVPK